MNTNKNSKKNKRRQTEVRKSSYYKSNKIVNYTIKGFASDNDQKSPYSSSELKSISISTINSNSSDEEGKNRRSCVVQIMADGCIIEKGEIEKDIKEEHRKFCGCLLLCGPNPKNISLPWFL